MMPGMNPKQMKKAMKKMGISTEEIDADEVIIKRNKGEIKIKNPQISKIKMQGQEIFQVQGDVAEEKFSEDDIKTVMDQTGSTKEEARRALEKNDDIAKAIMDLQ